MENEQNQKLAGITLAFLRRVDLKGEESPAHHTCSQFLEQIATGALIVTPAEPRKLQSVEKDGDSDSRTVEDSSG